VPETPIPPSQTPNPAPTSGRQILRMGLWNYVANRCGPRNAAARFALEIGVLVIFFAILAVLMVLAQS